MCSPINYCAPCEFPGFDEVPVAREVACLVLLVTAFVLLMCWRLAPICSAYDSVPRVNDTFDVPSVVIVTDSGVCSVIPD